MEAVPVLRAVVLSDSPTVLSTPLLFTSSCGRSLTMLVTFTPTKTSGKAAERFAEPSLSDGVSSNPLLALVFRPGLLLRCGDVESNPGPRADSQEQTGAAAGSGLGTGTEKTGGAVSGQATPFSSASPLELPPLADDMASMKSSESTLNGDSGHSSMQEQSSSASQDSSSLSNVSRFRGNLPLWKKVFVCAGFLVMESYITFEEIYLTTTLQRLKVPYALLSLPGVISGGCGTFVVPLLGFAMDRYRGGRRPFAVGTLLLLSAGMSIIIYTAVVSLYHKELPVHNQTLAAGDNSTTAGQTHSRTDSSDSASTGALVLTKLAAIAMAGFTLGDQGYDTSTLSVRTYILSISPSSHHNSLLLAATTVGAIGGCLTSLIGFLNLSAIFPEVKGWVLDKGDAQLLVQSVLFVFGLVVFFPPTICANRKFFDEDAGFFSSILPTKRKTEQPQQVLKEDELTSAGKLERRPLSDKSGAPDSFKNHGSCAESGTTVPRKAELEEQDPRRESQPAPKETAGQPAPKKRVCGCMSRDTKARLALMVMVFWVICALTSYFFYITNYVAEVIYQGDPHAPLGSAAYDRYVSGTRVGSLSMLTFYFASVFFNLCHGKILDKIGMKMEFVLSSAIVTVMMLIIVLTGSIVMVFLTAIPMAAYRACSYTVPFILANRLAQRENQSQSLTLDPEGDSGSSGSFSSSSNAQSVDTGGGAEEKDKKRESGGGGGGGGGDITTTTTTTTESPPSGLALASVTVMIPATYCLLCAGAGPLIAVTGNTSLPIYLAVGTSALGTISAAIVDFD